MNEMTTKGSVLCKDNNNGKKPTFKRLVAAAAMLTLLIRSRSIITTINLALLPQETNQRKTSKKAVVEHDELVFASPAKELFERWDHESSIPAPLRIMEQYIKWHSVLPGNASDNNNNNNNSSRSSRKAAIGFYSCPNQAGNRLHHFLNGLLWAIITNRTLLWKYWDSETCMKYDGKYYSKTICKSANTVDECDAILERAPWIPSYDEWSRQFVEDGDEDARPFELPYYATHHPNASVANSRFPWGEGNDEQVFGVDNMTKYPQRVVVFSQERYQDTILNDGGVRESLLHTEWSRQTAKDLYALGPSFLYGMLHRYSFAFSKSILSASPSDAVAADDDVVPLQTTITDTNYSSIYTIALHSRHRYPELDGCDIERETSCLRQILLRKKSQTQICVVAIMSDRECTITRLSQWLNKRNCTVRVAAHESGSSFLKEHGPFAGIGFFQDLAVVSTARSAFVGMERSSSDLLLELLEFERVMDVLRKGGPHALSQLHELDKCVMPFEGPKKANKETKNVTSVA